MMQFKYVIINIILFYNGSLLLLLFIKKIYTVRTWEMTECSSCKMIRPIYYYNSLSYNILNTLFNYFVIINYN